MTETEEKPEQEIVLSGILTNPFKWFVGIPLRTLALAIVAIAIVPGAVFVLLGVAFADHRRDVKKEVKND